jgi:hypothetical protein
MQKPIDTLCHTGTADGQRLALHGLRAAMGGDAMHDDAARGTAPARKGD